MSQPVLEYYWVKVLQDGKTMIPQFDYETGAENYWNADDVPLSKVLLVPFTADLVEKVIQNGVPAIATTNPPVEFAVEPGEKVEAGRDNIITYYDYFECEVCGWKFLHTDSSKFAECPQCHAKDEWWCPRCQEYKTNFHITKLGQVQCLECDIPVGLDRVRHLSRKSVVLHNCDYFIRSDKKKTVVTCDGKIIIS